MGFRQVQVRLEVGVRVEVQVGVLVEVQVGVQVEVQVGVGFLVVVLGRAVGLPFAGVLQMVLLLVEFLQMVFLWVGVL